MAASTSRSLFGNKVAKLEGNNYLFNIQYKKLLSS